MKAIIILITFLITTFCALAQDITAEAAAQEAKAMVMSDAYEINLWNLRSGDTTHIFADVAYIRDYPGTQGNLVDSLQVGQEVFIKSSGYNPSVIRGFGAPWCEIYYYKNQQKQEGYIWMGLLALSTIESNDGKLFIHGFSRYNSTSTEDQSPYYTAELKLLDSNRRPIGKTTYRVDDVYQTYQYAKLLDGMGLENIQNIHRFTYSGEACGIPTTSYYLGWTGKDFVRLPDKRSVGDAGVYYYEEKILFPSEHKGDKGLILKLFSEGEVIDYDAQELEYDEKEWRERYLWDGKTISQLIELKAAN